VINKNYQRHLKAFFFFLAVENHQEMVNLYNQEQWQYQQKIQEVERQWQSVKQQLYKQLIQEKDG